MIPASRGIAKRADYTPTPVELLTFWTIEFMAALAYLDRPN